MAPKFMEDPDTGACPPCGVMWDLETAKEFDKRGKKWFGKTGVDVYYEHQPTLWMRFTYWLRRRPLDRECSSG